MLDPVSGELQAAYRKLQGVFVANTLWRLEIRIIVKHIVKLKGYIGQHEPNRGGHAHLDRSVCSASNIIGSGYSTFESYYWNICIDLHLLSDCTTSGSPLLIVQPYLTIPWLCCRTAKDEMLREMSVAQDKLPEYRRLRVRPRSLSSALVDQRSQIHPRPM